MRHQKNRNKLSRDSAHRKALLSNLSREVIDHERIRTTHAKAKALRPEVEKLITLAKRGDLHARRQAMAALGQDKFVVYKLFEELEIGVRAYNCLKRAGIQTVGDLVQRSESELNAIPNFGKRSTEEVKESLHALGLGLRDE